jgi:hypothetical protein
MQMQICNEDAVLQEYSLPTSVALFEALYKPQTGNKWQCPPAQPPESNTALPLAEAML